DDHSKVVPRLPFPNRTVKRLRADDSGWTSVKVGHRQAPMPRPPPGHTPRGGFLCVRRDPRAEALLPPCLPKAKEAPSGDEPGHGPAPVCWSMPGESEQHAGCEVDSKPQAQRGGLPTL